MTLARDNIAPWRWS